MVYRTAENLGISKRRLVAILIKLQCYAWVFALLMFAGKAWGTICDSLDLTYNGDLANKSQFITDKQESINLTQWRGNIVILHFWVSWLPDCIEGMRELNALSEMMIASEEQDIVVIPIMVAGNEVKESIEKAQHFYANYKIEYLPIYLDVNGQLHREMQIEEARRSLPLTIIIDKNGREIGRMKDVTLWPHKNMARELRACNHY